MKKSELKTLVRQIVREEVAMAIHEVITELKQPTTKENKVVKQPKKKKVVSEKKHYTKNSILNEVMNETANDAEWKTMGNEPFTTNNMNNVLQNQYGNMMNGGKPTGDQMVASMGIDPNSVPDSLIDNMFNKDYSKLLKKVDEKTNQTRGV